MLGPSTSISSGPYPNSDSYSYGRGVKKTGVTISNIVTSGNDISFVFKVVTHRPTSRPTLKKPTRKPSRAPSLRRSKKPTKKPTPKPSPRKPSRKPTMPEPTKKPTRKPSTKPSLVRTKKPTSAFPVRYTGNPCIPDSTGKCPLCTGDCDNDSDCSWPLRCVQRHGGEIVPGCDFGSLAMSSDADYCELLMTYFGNN